MGPILSGVKHGNFERCSIVLLFGSVISPIIMVQWKMAGHLKGV